MVGNPLIDQGTLNRLIASVVVPDFPELNVTVSFLGKEAIRIAKAGDAVEYIDTQVGGVTSPQPYMRVTVALHLLRTQFLAGIYKAKLESDARIGSITVRPDSRAFPPYNFLNCSIAGVDDENLDGSDPGYRVRLGGYYPINNDLFDE